MLTSIIRSHFVDLQPLEQRLRRARVVDHDVDASACLERSIDSRFT
jgi:hypothetical protein